MADDPGKLILDRARDDQKPKLTRGLMATLPAHSQEEMREANSELGMALGVIREVVDAHVAGSLPPGKVTELVLARRRKADEVVLARRRAGLKGDEAVQPPEAAPAAQVVDLMEALKDSMSYERGHQGKP